MRLRHPRLALSLALVLGHCATLSAQDQPASDPVGLRGDVSGSWYNLEQSGHGLMIEVLDGGVAAVTWFTFAPDGSPMWLVGLGEIESHGIRAQVGTVEGGRFPPQFDPAAIENVAWGELQISFTGCDEGSLSWTPTAAGFTAGSMPLRRLTAIDGQRCNAAEEFGETRVFSFERGDQGFEVLFADKPPGEEEFYELDYQYEALPEPLQARRGVRLSGNNHSDDLAMLVKAPLRGLLPDRTYRVELSMEMASNVPTGCFGIGGSPGDSVYMRLGATTAEPLSAMSEPPDGWLRLNFDYGQQSQSGTDARVVGTLANRFNCDDGPEAPWQLKTLSTRGENLRARTDSEGTLWVVAGSDSAFEGRTDWYLTRLTVHLEPVADLAR